LPYPITLRLRYLERLERGHWPGAYCLGGAGIL
jgi:hypothetical protein